MYHTKTFSGATALPEKMLTLPLSQYQRILEKFVSVKILSGTGIFIINNKNKKKSFLCTKSAY